MGAGLPDSDSGDLHGGGSWDQPVKDEVTGMHPRLHLGQVGWIIVQEQGYRGLGGDIQREELVEGKFLIVWGNSGSVIF